MCKDCATWFGIDERLMLLRSLACWSSAYLMLWLALLDQGSRSVPAFWIFYREILDWEFVCDMLLLLSIEECSRNCIFSKNSGESECSASFLAWSWTHFLSVLEDVSAAWVGLSRFWRWARYFCFAGARRDFWIETFIFVKVLSFWDSEGRIS